MDSIIYSNKQIEINGLSFDFSDDKVSIYGSLDIKYDSVGLNNLNETIELMQKIKDELVKLEQSNILPKEDLDIKQTIKSNPFLS